MSLFELAFNLYYLYSYFKCFYYLESTILLIIIFFREDKPLVQINNQLDSAGRVHQFVGRPTNCNHFLSRNEYEQEH